MGLDSQILAATVAALSGSTDAAERVYPARVLDLDTTETLPAIVVFSPKERGTKKGLMSAMIFDVSYSLQIDAICGGEDDEEIAEGLDTLRRQILQALFTSVPFMAPLKDVPDYEIDRRLEASGTRRKGLVSVTLTLDTQETWSLGPDDGDPLETLHITDAPSDPVTPVDPDPEDPDNPDIQPFAEATIELEQPE